MTMFLVGSGPADSLDSVHDQFVAAAKKRGTRVAIALLGTPDEVGESLAGYAEPIQSRWPEVEIVPIWLDDDSEDGQDTTEWPEDLEQVAALVVAGGWTPGYLEALRPKRDVIATLVRRGAPYLGYSAGAMVVSKRAIVGGTRFRGRQMVPEVWGEGLDELELRDGLALIGPAVDVHGDVASLGRALAAVEKGEVSSVVAIDEGTCLVVDPVSGRTVVEGSQRIHWVQRDGGHFTVQHESSAVEVARHREFLEAEQKAAAAEAQARRQAEEQARLQREQEAERKAAEQAAAAQAEREAARQERLAQREASAVPAEVVAERSPGQETPEKQPAAIERTPAPGELPPVEAAASDAADEDPTATTQPDSTEPGTPEPNTSAGEPERSSAVAAAERAADEAAALEGEPVPDEYGQLHAAGDFAAPEADDRTMASEVESEMAEHPAAADSTEATDESPDEQESGEERWG